MPLLDHFHGPLSKARHWESFHGSWAYEMMGALNAGILPPGYFAEATVMPAIFPHEIEVKIFRQEGGPNLVGAVELVSPGNKDRPQTRRLFAAKCASYLQGGIGLVIVDVVTERSGNMHNELIAVMEKDEGFRLSPEPPLYTVGYRSSRTESGDQIEIWPVALEVAQPLATVPLALRGGPTVPLDLEATYMEVRKRSRL